MRSLLLATTVLLSAAAGLAQNPLTNTLLKDLNTGPSPLAPGSSPELLASAPGRAWFTAFDRLAGRRIWTTDGTTAGTVPLGDLSDDRDNELFVLGALALPNGRFLVATESTAHGVELFVSDRPGAPLQLLMDFEPGAASSQLTDLVLWQGEAWFAARTPQHGMELWHSDGTVAGTRISNELIPGAGSEEFQRYGLAVAGNQLYFTAGRPAQLYVKSVPNATPVVLTPTSLDLQPSAAPTWYMAEVNGRLVFPAADAMRGREPWSTDGTPRGTRLLENLWRGARESESVALASDGQRIWIAAREAYQGFELWVSDGTRANTRLVADLNPGRADGVDYQAGGIILPGGDLLFVGNDGSGSGFEPWRSDGTAQGTRPIADLAPGGATSQPRGFMEFAGEVWFHSFTPASGRQLQRFDPATSTITTIPPGNPPWYFPVPMADLGNSLFLYASTEATGIEPWTIGTAPGSQRLLLDIATGGNADSDPWDFTASTRGFALFRAETAAAGAEPWVTDGTAAGTVSLGDLMPGTQGAWPRALGELAEGLLFQAFSPRLPGHVLWITNGTRSGTRELVTIAADGLGVIDEVVTLSDELMLFVCADLAATTLWRTDGTAANTQVIARYSGSGVPRLHAAAGDHVLGEWLYGVGERELFVTDGTPNGTGIVDLMPGSNGSYPVNFTAIGDRVVFVARDPLLGRELFVAGGSPFGVQRFTNGFPPGGGTFSVNEIASLGDFAVFVSEDVAGGNYRFWRTDGTQAGTVTIDQNLPTDIARLCDKLTGAGDLAFFWTRPQGSPGYELWVTDGTPQGFRSLRAAMPGESAPGPYESDLHPIGDGTHVVFERVDAVHGHELWVSDGTVAGTRVLTDSAPGVLESTPYGMTRVGNRMLFAADDGTTGVEPHAVDLFDVGGSWVAHPYGDGCGAGIDTSGSPTLGDPFAVEVSSGNPNALTLFRLGFGADYLRLDSGCSSHLVGPLPLVALHADPLGVASLAFTVPNQTALLGAQLFFQAFPVVPGGPLFGSYAGTPGLEVVVGR